MIIIPDKLSLLVCYHQSHSCLYRKGKIGMTLSLTIPIMLIHFTGLASVLNRKAIFPRYNKEACIFVRLIARVHNIRKEESVLL